MFMGLFAMVLSRGCMLFCFGVLANSVMMLSLMMVMCSRMMMGGS